MELPHDRSGSHPLDLLVKGGRDSRDTIQKAALRNGHEEEIT